MIEDRLKWRSRRLSGPDVRIPDDARRMTETTGRYADFEGLRERARALRLQGLTYDRIRAELGCSKSSVSLWVRDLPRPARSGTGGEVPAAARRGREAALRRREEERRETKRAAAGEIGAMSDRELFLLGVGLYWAEGSKAKPYRPQERVTFVNSDPGMITVFLAWLRLLDVPPEHLRFHVHIHESADVSEAERFWAGHVGHGPESFGRTTVKKHNPTTNRRNTGERYRGCLVVRVNKGAELYRRIEGWWYGIVLGADPANRRNVRFSRN